MERVSASESSDTYLDGSHPEEALSQVSAALPATVFASKIEGLRSAGMFVSGFFHEFTKE